MGWNADRELALGDRAGQVAAEHERRDVGGVALRHVPDDARPAPLGLVHRHVGPPEQLDHGAVGGRRSVGRRHRRACRRRQPRPRRWPRPVPACRPGRSARPGWPAARGPAARPARRRAGRPAATANSSPPRRATRSSGPTARGQPPRHLGQQPVAGEVAERLVDLAEQVEVEHDERGRSPGRRSTPSPYSSSWCRLARPVSGSCWAAWALRRASRRASAYAAALRTAVRRAETKVRRVSRSRSVSCTRPA